ncbi:AraC family transcriptional regulator [Cohnella herbarum]|uniref:AraC family transcriptional regulator n=1 Tax=Cohnella herbarum TaxID=2728023 RepID=A0A7Z2VRR1_9BACL|nr:AraC family transcriptional regulator [Cohnella herbarum]
MDLIEMNPSETLAWMSDYHCPPYITLAHSFHAPEGWLIENRTLKQYALQYVLNGMAEYPVAGGSYVTVKGDLLFHRPGEQHSIRTVENHPYVCISIVFHFGQTSFPLDELFQDRHHLGNFTGQPIERKLGEIVQLYSHPGLDRQLKCQGLLMQVLAEASQGKGQEEANAGGASNHAKLILLKNYLITHYHQEVRHSDLEGVTGLSRNHMILIFKKTFGMTPMQFLTWVRIQKAKELAIQTDLSVSEIARNVGYSDVHTFGKMFKKNTGSSLTQFCNTLTTDYLNTRPRIIPLAEENQGYDEP